MQAAHVQLIRTSIAQIRPIAGLAGACFYERLFACDPSLRPLFQADLKLQGRKLMEMLRLIAVHLDRLDALVPVVAELGRRHRAYGVCDAHYEAVGQALLWTLEHLLGPGFTPELRQAWQEAYLILAHLMQAAAPERTSPIGSR
jgi:hemoglobin-like flavoprotein